MIHWWRSRTRVGFYVDAARSIAVRAHDVAYVDLYLGLAYDAVEGWTLLDEAELMTASAADAERARRAIVELRELVAARSPLFDLDAASWSSPPDAAALKARQVGRLL